MSSISLKDIIEITRVRRELEHQLEVREQRAHALKAILTMCLRVSDAACDDVTPVLKSYGYSIHHRRRCSSNTDVSVANSVRDSLSNIYLLTNVTITAQKEAETALRITRELIEWGVPTLTEKENHSERHYDMSKELEWFANLTV